MNGSEPLGVRTGVVGCVVVVVGGGPTGCVVVHSAATAAARTAVGAAFGAAVAGAACGAVGQFVGGGLVGVSPSPVTALTSVVLNAPALTVTLYVTVAVVVRVGIVQFSVVPVTDAVPIEEVMLPATSVALSNTSARSSVTVRSVGATPPVFVAVTV